MYTNQAEGYAQGLLRHFDLRVGNNDYATAVVVVSILLPLRYDLGYLGGSWAQRQVFSITLIQATINSKQLPLALALVAELKAQKPCSKMLANLFQTLKTAYEEQKSLAASEL